MWGQRIGHHEYVRLFLTFVRQAALWSRMLRRKRAVEEERVLEARECCMLRGRWKLVSGSYRTAEEPSFTDTRPVESSVLNQSC